jgi:thiamine pyrophosphate-dependent acetolactate synthase large subunit-like protein
LTIVVIDNGHFGETGMQRSHTGHGLEIARVAQACGLEACVLRSLEEIEALRAELRRKPKGPRLYVIKVKAENVPRSLPPRDAVHLKNRFRTHLGLPIT